MRHSIFWIVSLFLVSLAHAGELRNEAARDLAGKIARSLAGDPTDLVLIGAVDDGFRTLDRTKVPPEDLNELKFMVLHWRKNLSDRLTARAARFGKPEDLGPIADALSRAGAQLTPEQTEMFASGGVYWKNQRKLPREIQTKLSGALAVRGAPDQAKRMLELLYGPDLEKDPVGVAAWNESGPAASTGIIPVKPSGLDYTQWTKNPEFKRYRWEKDGSVTFRGEHFKPGDYILINQDDDTDQLFTTYTYPRTQFAHFAMYVPLQTNDGWYPAIVEIFEHGYRADTLSNYFDRVSVLAEIYRQKGLPTDTLARLQPVVRQALADREHHYDLTGEKLATCFTTCSKAGHDLFQSAGLPTITTRSKVDPRAQRNMDTLGLTAKSFLTPSDYIRDPQVEYVGQIDNGKFELMLCRELIIAAMEDLLLGCRLDIRSVHDSYRFLSRAAKQMQLPTIRGALIRAHEGYDRDTFPVGPPRLMAFSIVADKEGKKAVNAFCPDGKLPYGYSTTEPFSFEAFRHNPLVAERVRQVTTKLRSWFSDCETSPAAYWPAAPGAAHR